MIYENSSLENKHEIPHYELMDGAHPEKWDTQSLQISKYLLQGYYFRIWTHLRQEFFKLVIFWQRNSIMAEMESVHEQHSIRLTKSSPDNHKISPQYHDFIAGAVGGSLRKSSNLWFFCWMVLLSSHIVYRLYHIAISRALFETRLSVACSHPMDTIKTRLQTTNNYRGIIDCAKKMIQKEGFRSLYKG